MTATRDQAAAAPVPARPGLTRLREATQSCHACELWEGATQAVLGEGSPKARLMLVGERVAGWLHG